MEVLFTVFAKYQLGKTIFTLKRRLEVGIMKVFQSQLMIIYVIVLLQKQIILLIVKLLAKFSIKLKMMYYKFIHKVYLPLLKITTFQFTLLKNIFLLKILMKVMH